MIHLRGKKVLVVGLARTGLATLKFLREKGSLLSASEIRTREEMREVWEELRSWEIEIEWGGHSIEHFLRQDLIILSPGVDPNIEPVQEALKKGIPVISEIELAYHFLKAPLIAITGTNGKTTTTLLTGEMLKEEGKRVGIGGNVGEPLILFADGKEPWDVLVVEISSFQLERIEKFRPRCAVLLNITEDHLDRYPNYNAYIQAKLRIFENQTIEDWAILNRDDPVVMSSLDKIFGKKLFFTMGKAIEEGAFSNGEEIFLRIYSIEERYSLKETPLKGVHNIENMMAAILAARLFGCSPRTIQNVLKRFQGLEHRLEFVREIGGVRFYNDSKGTNVGSVVKSLQSFSEPVILIAGGKDKKTDLSPLRDLIQKRVKRLILIGEARERMAQELSSFTETLKAESLEEAVSLAYQTSQPGDVVLLSPACSSFDMFKDYRERGNIFKELVRRL